MNDEVVFFKQLYKLLELDYNYNQILMILSQFVKKDYITSMNNDLSKGETFELSILHLPINSKLKEYLSFFLKNHTLKESIKSSLELYTKEITLKKDVIKKLSYPSILTLFLFFFSIFINVFLIPKVNELYLSFQVKQSILYRLVFFLLTLLPKLFVLSISIIIVSILILYICMRYKRYSVIEHYLKVPIVGDLIRKYYSYRFCKYYEGLKTSDIDDYQTINALNDLLTQSDLKIVLYEVLQALNKGETLNDIINEFDYFEDLFKKMFSIYMNNPQDKESLIQYLEITSSIFDLYIEKFFKWFIPVVYMFVSVFVIGVYISIVIPMMNIISEI